MQCRRVWAALLVLALGGQFGLPQPARAGDESEINQMLQRLDRLEKKNQELKQKLERGGEESEAAPGAAPAIPVSPDQVKKIVGDYIKDQDIKKKSDDDKKKKEQEDLGYEVGKDTTFKAAWKDGLWFETGDKAFKFHIGGRADYDSGWYHAPNNINRIIDPTSATTSRGLSDGSDFRRARIRFEGTCWEVFDFITEYEFVNTLTGQPPGPDPLGVITGAGFRELWVAANEIPVIGTIKAGKQREFLTFANATSGNFLPFMERPYIFDAFINDNQFSDGLVFTRNYCEDRASSFVGVFRTGTQNTAAQIGDGEYALDARVTAQVFRADEGREWVHLGVSGSTRQEHFDATRNRVRPLVFTGAGTQTPSILNTGTIFARNGQDFLGLEFASVFNRLTLTAEWATVRINDAFQNGLPGKIAPPAGAVIVPRGNLQYQGWYAEALYFLTPDYRPYNKRGSYDRIRPLENVFFVRNCDGYLFGRGAWELGARWDHIDLADGNQPTGTAVQRAAVGAGPQNTGNTNGAAPAVASTIPANFAGTSDAVTIGLNWFLNPNMKIQFNYVWTYLNYVNTPANSGSFDSFGVRLHWDF